MKLRLFTICAFICAYTVSCYANKKSGSKQMWGLNRSGVEYSCVQYDRIFDGPSDDKSIETMMTWNINIVRVPLNEDCWLGINGHNPAVSGANYRKPVKAFIKRLRNHNLTVILDLHWTDGLYDGEGQGTCYNETAMCQKPMPDKKNAPKFWHSVAKTFKHDDGIIFELFNEPFPDKATQDKDKAWKCLRDGGNCSGIPYEVAGMQDLVDAVRSTGAKNRILLPGIEWTNDMSRWIEFLPNDPANNFMAAWHSYNINACNNTQCWEENIAPIAEKYPMIVTECGEYTCKHSYIVPLLKWLDKKNINYLTWTWNVWDCAAGPALITDYDGTPNRYGKGVKKHYLSKKNYI